uniref:phosphoserine transaminase n=1 Tax=Strombidium rassoulzadegani TaxID=1082188 RepID=A0A7S3CTD0_9SPIT|mmetsp:Transcript_7926/g.13300  ORF Transcript_7926/g.13300 Transcript_7926/m.13300 type:complete len:240 (+) Transcript_7926:623-1342(+)
MRKVFNKVKQECGPDTIIVSDMSSAIGSRDLSKMNLWEDIGIIYAGAQKNFGTSGLTYLLVRDDVLERVKRDSEQQRIPIPIMMDWKKQASVSDYFVNTPALLSVQVSQLMCEHMLSKGGISYYEELAKKKSELIYDCLDSSVQANLGRSSADLQFVNKVSPTLRSRMNVPFNVTQDGLDAEQNKELESKLLNELVESGFCGLKGHKSLGGLRASIYNSLELGSVEALVDYLKRYQRKQ